LLLAAEKIPIASHIDTFFSKQTKIESQHFILQFTNSTGSKATDKDEYIRKGIKEMKIKGFIFTTIIGAASAGIPIPEITVSEVWRVT
jgi:hypothetical protein